MALDKILSKLQLQIKEIVPTIELFVDDTIQPSVNDCEALQQQLIALQESLIIYKYSKTEKEISPSFNIHSKVSEKQVEESQIKNIEPQNKPIEVQKPVISNQEMIDIPSSQIKKINIGLNDKFRFINELFKQSNTEYNVAYEQLNALNTWYDSELYLNSLKEVYQWKETADTVKHLYSIIKKRFD